MFFLRIKQRRRRKQSNSCYIIAMLCLSFGMVLGYFNIPSEVLQLTAGTVQPVMVFRFSMLKNSLLLFFTYLNAFSVLGFPLIATTLAVSGYLLTQSTASLFLKTQVGKFTFIIKNLPHIALVIVALLILSECAMRFSQMLFMSLTKGSLKENFLRRFVSLTAIFIVCLAAVFFAALYEGYMI